MQAETNTYGMKKLFFKARKKSEDKISELQRRLLACGVSKISLNALYTMQNKLERDEKLEKLRPDVLAGLFFVAGDTDSDFARDMIRTYLKQN